MRKLLFLAVPAVLAACLWLAGAASATPLSDLDGAPAAGLDLGTGYLDADITDSRSTSSAPDESESAGDAAAGRSSAGGGLAQDWLLVRARFGADADDSVLETSFGAPSENHIGSSSAIDEDMVEKISLDELARRALRNDGLVLRLRGEGRGDGRGGRGGYDLGLNLVKSVLDTRIDRELALASRAHTMEIRQFLLEHTTSDHVGEYEVRDGASSSPAAARSAAAAVPKETLIASAELDRIKRKNEGSTIKSLKQFVIEFLIDFRIFFFFGLSLLLIMLLTALVTRWSRI